MQNQKIPIIFIPVYNDLLSFKEVVESIYNSTNYTFHLLIIESGSTDGAKEYCDLLPKLYPDKSIEIIHTIKNGAVKAYNQAFQIALERKQDIYMTQTDAVHFKYKSDWLSDFVLLSERYNPGAIIMNNSSGICHGRYIEGFEWAGFWGIYIPHSTIVLIGGFDENYEIGDAVDIDWSYRVYLARLNILKTRYSNDHHHQTAHVNEDRSDLEEIKKRNGEYFRRKYEDCSTDQQ